jgi:hypothetical protein
MCALCSRRTRVYFAAARSAIHDGWRELRREVEAVITQAELLFVSPAVVAVVESEILGRRRDAHLHQILQVLQQEA